MNRDEVEWAKLREMVFHRDGKCMNCGATMGLQVHHIKSRGSGGLNVEENVITLCVYCHDCAGNGFIVPGRRLQRGETFKKKIPIREGGDMQDYFRNLLGERYGYKYS